MKNSAASGTAAGVQISELSAGCTLVKMCCCPAECAEIRRYRCLVESVDISGLSICCCHVCFVEYDAVVAEDGRIVHPLHSDLIARIALSLGDREPSSCGSERRGGSRSSVDPHGGLGAAGSVRNSPILDFVAGNKSVGIMLTCSLMCWYDRQSGSRQQDRTACRVPSVRIDAAGCSC